MITKVMIIHFESSQQQRVEHSPNPSLCCGLDSGQDYWVYQWFSDRTYEHYADLNLGFNCSCKIVIIHDISGIISQWVWDNCTDKYWSPCCCGRDTDLSLMIGHSSLSFWIFICWWIPWWFFSSKVNLRDIIIFIFCDTWGIHIKVTCNSTQLKRDNQWVVASKGSTNLIAWVVLFRFSAKNLGTSLFCTPFRWHCMGHKRWLTRQCN